MYAIGAGVAVVGGGTATIVIAETDIETAKQDLQTALVEQVNFKNDFKMAEIVKGKIADLKNSSSDAVIALRSLVEQWTTMESQFNAIRETLASTTVDPDWYDPDTLASWPLT